MPRTNARTWRGAGRGNTPRAPLQEQGMTTAQPPTIAPPLAYRQPPPRTGRFIRDDAAARAPVKSRSGALAFQLFVDENRHLFADYIARRLDGPHKNSAEDALQEGLMKIWSQWEDWPEDPDQQIRFARQSLKFAALETVRKRTGRDGSPRAGEVVVDFSTVDNPIPAAPSAERLARDLGRAIAEGSLVKDQIGYLEKASLVAAIATLTDLEQRVLFMTARGDDCKEIAEDLGVTHQQAREALMRARRLCRMLIEHADGEKISAQESRLLWQYRDGELSGKRARELKRHVEHCTACKRLLGLEESVQKAGMHVVLPLPVVLMAAGKPAAVAAGILPSGASGAPAGAAGSGAVIGSGGSAGVQLGGTILAAQAPTTFTGSVIAGVTAKVGLALGTLATASSMAGVYKLAHDKQHSQAAPAAPAHVAPAPAKTTPRTVTPARTTAARKPAPTRRKAKTAKPAAKAKTAGASARAAPRQQQAPSSTPAPTVTPQQTAPTQTPQTQKPAGKSAGGEFLIGNN